MPSPAKTDDPIVFLKPASSLCTSGEWIELPKSSRQVDHEVEVVIAIGHGGKNIKADSVLLHLAGIAIGIDITARDLQSQAKEKGLPWTLSKGFDTFAAVSAFVPPPQDPLKLANMTFDLSVNGEFKQKGNTADMITPIPQLIEYLSHQFTLSAGDLIFTGTPKGVGPIRAGDRLVARLEDWATLDISAR